MSCSSTPTFSLAHEFASNKSWTSDLNDEGKCSLDIVVEWLITNGNYDEYHSQRKDARSKDTLVKEINELLQKTGHIERKPEGIREKIRVLRLKFIEIHDQLKSKDFNVDPFATDHETRIRDYVIKKFKYYYLLIPLFKGRPTITRPTNNLTNPALGSPDTIEEHSEEQTSAPDSSSPSSPLSPPPLSQPPQPSTSTISQPPPIQPHPQIQPHPYIIQPYPVTYPHPIPIQPRPPYQQQIQPRPQPPPPPPPTSTTPSVADTITEKRKSRKRQVRDVFYQYLEYKKQVDVKKAKLEKQGEKLQVISKRIEATKLLKDAKEGSVYEKKVLEILSDLDDIIKSVDEH